MKKIIGIVGSGMVGRDPFHPQCWSRSGYNLFQTLIKENLLHRAFGVEVPWPLRAFYLGKNFHFRKDRWRQKLYLDPGYYSALTKEIKKSLFPSDFEKDCALLQIGGHYNAAEAAEQIGRAHV